MALKHTGKCMGGPWHGQERTYFSEEMDVTHLDGNPLVDLAFKVVGTYKHDGRGLWTWFGPGTSSTQPRS